MSEIPHFNHFDARVLVLDVLGGYDFLEHFAYHTMRYVGSWAMVFIPAGYFLSAISRVEERGLVANVICEASLYFSAALGFYTFYHYVNMIGLHEAGTVDVMWALSILAIILISRIPGVIIRHFISR